MNRMKRWMAATLVAASLPLTSCTTTAVVRPARANMVYVEGRWVYPPRPSAAWVPGHWERRSAFTRVWIPGHWRG